MEPRPATPTGYRDPDETMEDRSEDDADATHAEPGTNGDSKNERLPSGRPWTEADGPTDYSLFSNPPSLGLIRQRLFDVEDQIEMSPSDFDTYFPFVDNVWRKTKGGEGGDETAHTEIFWCRLRKSANQKAYVPKPTPEGKTSRKKRVREEKTCPMSIRIVRREGAVRTCLISRATGADVRHSHDLDYMDEMKRNTGIMDTARREAVKGFLPGSIFWKMLEEPDRMEEAGGKHMKISDVRNVQYAWRQANPSEVLKAHAGYNQAKTGPRGPRLDGASPAQPIPQQPVQQARPQAPLPPPQFAPRPTAPPPLAPVPPPVDKSREALQYPQVAREFLEGYLPNPAVAARRTRPHVTLTWATSLDARISLLPGVQTAISGPETKAMTHYLRSRHDAIIIGVRTAIADDPSLNCRLAGAYGYGGTQWGYQQPRPIIIDPHARLHVRPEMKVLQVAQQHRAKAPWIVVSPNANLHPAAVSTLKAYGGEYLMIHDVNPATGHLNWEGILNVLFKEGIHSVMIEGGGQVLSELLKPRYGEWIDSVITTIAPTFFGRAGVEVSPEPTFDRDQRPIATRLKNVRWQPMGDVDVVMCGQMKLDESPSNGILPGIEDYSRERSEQHHQQHAPAPPPPPSHPKQPPPPQQRSVPTPEQTTNGHHKP